MTAPKSCDKPVWKHYGIRIVRSGELDSNTPPRNLRNPIPFTLLLENRERRSRIWRRRISSFPAGAEGSRHAQVTVTMV